MMPETSFAGLVLVCAVAFGAPLGLGLLGARRIPTVVVEIVGGIAIGPAVLGWVAVDEAIEILALVGLAFLLFLAGLEIELRELRGERLRLAAIGFALSIVIGLAVGWLLAAAGLVGSPLLVAIVLLATSLGILVPLLKDAGGIEGPFGQLVIAGATIGDFGAILLLSLFFSRDGSGPAATLLLVGLLVVLGVLLGIAFLRAERWARLSRVLVRLQDTTAQIRIRGAFLFLVAFTGLAQVLGLEVILGAFLAGAILALVDRDEMMTHQEFRNRIEAVGFGIFVPIFFVTSGLRFDLGALFASASSIALVPVFVVALVAVRGLPAVVYRRTLGPRRTVAAGLFQATSLPFIVAATQIGLELGAIEPGTAAGLVAAGLVSVLAFPAAGLALLRSRGRAPDREPPTRPRRNPIRVV